MKQIERDIDRITDAEELDRIGQQSANSGNYAVAMKAWLRASELGNKQVRPRIATIFFRGIGVLGNEDNQKAAKLIKLWREEGDEEVVKAIELQMKLRAVLK